MLRVICDTNVWYEIGEGRLSIDSNICLVATESSIYELVVTPI